MASGRMADGTRWSVRRRWLPWRRRTKAPDWLDATSVPDVGGADDLVGIVLMILVAIVVIPVVIFVFVFGLEFLLLLLLLPFVMVGRMLFGLPWTVVVRVGGKVVGEHPAVGWAGSGELIDRIATQFDSRGGYHSG